MFSKGICRVNTDALGYHHAPCRAPSAPYHSFGIGKSCARLRRDPVATQRARKDEDLLEMAMRTVIQPSRATSSPGHSADLDSGTALNGHSAPAPGSEIEGHWPEVPAPRPAEEDAPLALTLRLNRMARETAALAQRVEELETELEQRSRRLQQLMGERDELRSLLARRDVELSRLNREIGAIGARAEPAAGRSPVLFAAAQRLLDKLQNARRTSRRARPAAPRPHQADRRAHEKRLVPWAKNDPPRDVLGVVAFGLSEAEIQRVLQVVEPYCTEHEIAPLLLTDNDSFELFRNRRVLFEFLPAPSEQERLAPDLDWQLFTLRRLALIRRKWQPSRVVAFGRRATEVVQLWLDSPFEETPISATLKGRSAGNEVAWGAPQPSALER